MSPARILLVHGNKSGLAARKAVLDELGHRITTASCGEEALEHFSHTKFDLVVTDYRMPKMDGKELIKRIRSLHPEIPVIMLSGYVESLGLNESNTGADLIIQKSANEVTHLIRAVSRTLRKTHKKPAARHHTPSKAKRVGA
jgi:CheY-like chemotaxis protein